jgi:hypothetical protein
VTGIAVALFRDPWRQAAADPLSLRHPWRLWRKAVWLRANPRDAGYMHALLAEQFPAVPFIDADGDSGWEAMVAGAATVVLLYPDSIGLGFMGLESRARRIAPNAGFIALNGRRRQFALDAAARRRLCMRRFFEWTMLLEFLMGVALVIATPFLWAFDCARGRR